MTKKEFLKLIKDNKSNFGGILLKDGTLVRDKPRFLILIWWKTGSKTEVVDLPGQCNSPKALETLQKYENWIN